MLTEPKRYWKTDVDPERFKMRISQTCLQLAIINVLAWAPVIRIRIRIHQIHMFLRLPDPDPLVRGKDPDPDPSISKKK